MLEPGRQFTTGNSFRYGFNGEENLPEISLDDYDFGSRVYNSRLGRWMSTDPMSKDYANLTPYNSMGNNPVLFIDPSGETIIINAKNLQSLLRTIDALAANAITKNGGNAIKRLHEETTEIFIIKAFRGANNSYTSTSNTMYFDPYETINDKKGYRKHPAFSLGHELDHMDKDQRGYYFSRGISEAYGVNAENELRSIYGNTKFETKYDFGLWSDLTTNDSEDFKDMLDPNPNSIGESALFTERKIIGYTAKDLVPDSKSEYQLETVGIFDAEAKEVKELKKGMVYYFDYKKDKDSKVEKKAVILKVNHNNGPKK